MGDHADDAVHAALDEEHRTRNRMLREIPHDNRFKDRDEVQIDTEHALTRLRQKLKARGETNAFLRVRPRIDD